MEHDEPNARTPLSALVRVFLKLGFFGFGGPAAHVAMLEEDVVLRRRWLSHQRFLDLLGATNLIPGPNSTEMCMHIGYLRRGAVGMVVSWACFVVPAACMALALACAYGKYGKLPELQPFLMGIKPAVLAVIAGAVWRLGRRAVRGWRLGAVGVAVTLAVALGAHPILALAAGGVVGMVWLRLPTAKDGGHGAAGAAALAVSPARTAVEAAVATSAVGTVVAVSFWKLGLFFLKVGAVLYGSGYVLVAFLEADLVRHYRWLTQSQLLDAIAVGQMTPGPLLTTATFIGYLVAQSAGLSGVTGAVVATVAFCLPSFLFVMALNPILPRLRRSVWAGAFLDAVNVSAVGLMVAVGVNLARQTLTSWPAWLIATAAITAALRWKVAAVWLVLGGAASGWLLGQWLA